MFFLFKSKASFEAEVSRHSMELCEQIISEMGAELHDDLIQKLSVFRLYIDRLERSRSDSAEAESIITSMQADFQEVIQVVRRISRQLMPVKMNDDSLQKTISTLCQNMERPGAGTIHFETSGTEVRITSQAEVYIGRIVQELIHNALKHSSAWHVYVRLIWKKNKLILEVEDDGTGFSKISEAIASLKKKHNTLRMRSNVIGAKIKYREGNKGLLARISYRRKA